MPFFHRPPRSQRQPWVPASAAPAPDSHPALGAADTVAGYAVVDLETTGLSPTADAIVEIGLVLTDLDGNPTDSWATLIDPGRDVGPTFIHGIQQADVVGAPQFSQIADLLAYSLHRRVVVAHNARFDAGFLSQNLGATGNLAEQAHIPRVCTMERARQFIETPSRRLTTCCEVVGIDISNHHSALDDAHASAALLRHYLNLCQGVPPWESVLAQAAGFAGWSWEQSAVDAGRALLTPRS